MHKYVIKLYNNGHIYSESLYQYLHQNFILRVGVFLAGRQARYQLKSMEILSVLQTLLFIIKYALELNKSCGNACTSCHPPQVLPYLFSSLTLIDAHSSREGKNWTRILFVFW